MRLGKKVQYALLFVLYLARSGRARTTDAAVNLQLSVHFLEQVARKLRQAGIIKSVRGPGGGYELVGDVSIGTVLDAMKVQPLITQDETEALQRGNAEHRALAEIVGKMSFNLSKALSAPVVGTQTSLAKAEGAQLDSLGSNPTVQ